LRITVRARRLTDLIDELAPDLVTTVARIEQPWVDDRFQADGQLAPTPSVAKTRGLLEAKLEKRFG